MFDAVYCDAVRTADRAVVDCAALLALVRLLDHQQVAGGSVRHEPATLQTAAVAPAPPEPSGAERHSSKPAFAGRGSTKVRGVVSRTPAGRGSQRKQDERRLP